MDGEHVLLRAEGQNLNRFVFDTGDLSSVRGGSLLLLGIADALEHDVCDDRGKIAEQAVFSDSAVANQFAEKAQRISTGASIALFRLHLKPGSDPKQLRADIERLLGEHRRLRYATVAVDIETLPHEDAAFRRARERAILANRRRQLRAPTVVAALDPLSAEELKELDGNYETEFSGERACDIDRVNRALVSQQMKDGARHPIGRATWVRRAAGNDAKREQFYKNYGHRQDVPPHYSWDLEQLACNAPEAMRQLDRKMAVLYIDGNKFSRKQDEALRHAGKLGSAGAQRKFDEAVQAKRSDVLGGLIDEMITHAPKVSGRPLWGGAECQTKELPRGTQIGPWFNWVNRHFDYPNGQRDANGWRGRRGWGAVVRFETLLWGGDELLWVMPAWKGWEVLTRFYRQDWQIAFGDGTPCRLTHAAGLVFCHYNAPIQRIKNLAKSLCELCKTQNDKEKREVDRLAYQVLESFDLVSGDIGRHRDDFLPKGVAPPQLLLEPKRLKDAHQQVARLKEKGLPNRQLHRLAEHVRDGEAYRLVVRDQQRHKAEQDDIGALHAAFGGCNGGWYNLIQLWEYIAPEAAMTAREPLEVEVEPAS